jgi:hypothetical protein
MRDSGHPGLQAAARIEQELRALPAGTFRDHVFGPVLAEVSCIFSVPPSIPPLWYPRSYFRDVCVLFDDGVLCCV